MVLRHDNCIIVSNSYHCLWVLPTDALSYRPLSAYRPQCPTSNPNSNGNPKPKP